MGLAGERGTERGNRTAQNKKRTSLSAHARNPLNSQLWQSPPRNACCPDVELVESIVACGEVVQTVRTLLIVVQLALDQGSTSTEEQRREQEAAEQRGCSSQSRAQRQMRRCGRERAEQRSMRVSVRCVRISVACAFALSLLCLSVCGCVSLRRDDGLRLPLQLSRSRGGQRNQRRRGRGGAGGGGGRRRAAGGRSGAATAVHSRMRIGCEGEQSCERSLTQTQGCNRHQRPRPRRMHAPF